MEKDSHMVFDLVKEFLQNAGQSQMILQVCLILFVCCYCDGDITPDLSACSKGFLYIFHSHLLWPVETMLKFVVIHIGTGTWTIYFGSGASHFFFFNVLTDFCSSFSKSSCVYDCGFCVFVIVGRCIFYFIKFYGMLLKYYFSMSSYFTFRISEFSKSWLWSYS